MVVSLENIVLIGMPLSGKSTLGRELSKILKYDLIDTDTLIEEMEDKSIKEIFKIYGEDYFREKELEIINKLKKKVIKLYLQVEDFPYIIKIYMN